MITESGSIKTSTPLNADMQRELTKLNLILGIIYIALSGICLVIFVALCLIDGLENFSAGLGVDLFFLLLLLFIGLLLILSRANALKEVEKFRRVGETEFFNDYLVYREYTSGEFTSYVKLYYSWIVRVKQTANYVFIYNTRVTAIPILKAGLTPPELNTMLSKLNQAPLPARAEGVDGADNSQQQ